MSKNCIYALKKNTHAVKSNLLLLQWYSVWNSNGSFLLFTCIHLESLLIMISFFFFYVMLPWILWVFCNRCCIIVSYRYFSFFFSSPKNFTSKERRFKTFVWTMDSLWFECAEILKIWKDKFSNCFWALGRSFSSLIWIPYVYIYTPCSYMQYFVCILYLMDRQALLRTG